MNESDMIEFRMQERRGISAGIEYYSNSMKLDLDTGLDGR